MRGRIWVRGGLGRPVRPDPVAQAALCSCPRRRRSLRRRGGGARGWIRSGGTQIGRGWKDPGAATFELHGHGSLARSGTCGRENEAERERTGGGGGGSRGRGREARGRGVLLLLVGEAGRAAGRPEALAFGSQLGRLEGDAGGGLAADGSCCSGGSAPTSSRASTPCVKSGSRSSSSLAGPPPVMRRRLLQLAREMGDKGMIFS